jgi:hypothetical protein
MLSPMPYSSSSDNAIVSFLLDCLEDLCEGHGFVFCWEFLLLFSSFALVLVMNHPGSHAVVVVRAEMLSLLVDFLDLWLATCWWDKFPRILIGIYIGPSFLFGVGPLPYFRLSCIFV